MDESIIIPADSPNQPPIKVSKELQPARFNNIIRVIKNGSSEHVLAVRQITFETLRRLRVKRDVGYARTGIPKGSDQVNLGSFIEWCRSIKKGDKGCIHQLRIIDATAVRRGE